MWKLAVADNPAQSLELAQHDNALALEQERLLVYRLLSDGLGVAPSVGCVVKGALVDD